MGFTDTLKRSLGFEETEPGNKSENGEGSFTNILHGLGDEFKREINNLRGGASDYKPQYQSPQPTDDINPQSAPDTDAESMPRPTPIYDDYGGYDDYDDYVIVPEQSFYEIVLIRPKSIDDVNYVIDQILEEKNPVIIDLSFLERESPANFKLAGEKIKLLRERYDAQALLLSRCDERNLIILAPNKVKLINKS